MAFGAVGRAKGIAGGDRFVEVVGESVRFEKLSLLQRLHLRYSRFRVMDYRFLTYLLFHRAVICNCSIIVYNNATFKNVRIRRKTQHLKTQHMWGV